LVGEAPIIVGTALHGLTLGFRFVVLSGGRTQMTGHVPDADLFRRFERDMEAIHDKAKAIGYNATRYLVMLREHGGLETAHWLLSGNDVSYGFTELWLMGRQDLTVEALAIKPEYAALFSRDELAKARERLGS
jgi:hypothetical protein